jgi:hypothetical protein
LEEEEQEKETVHDRKKYVDLITYTYGNNDREFNWLNRFRGSCICKFYSTYLSKTNYGIDARLIRCLVYTLRFLAMEECEKKKKKKRKSYSLQDSRHLWWYTMCMCRIYNTNKVKVLKEKIEASITTMSFC